MKGIVIVFEGLPGAGKSTLCRKMHEKGAVLSSEVTTASGRVLTPCEIGQRQTPFFLQNDLQKYSKAINARSLGQIGVIDRGVHSTLAYALLLDQRDNTEKYREACRSF